ncbi:MAG: iron ABC transporter permease [Candidatus Omnitrophica bacterium]|nr:iron ABC transporter permease [Candidatus Omnitrophota bacterium]
MKEDRAEHNSEAVRQYARYKRRKVLVGLFLLAALFAVAVYSVCAGSVRLSIGQIVDALFRHGDRMHEVIIWNIRLPRVLAAIIAGMGLAVAGCVMQCVLRNPLASPFTMGISQGAGFGAAFAIIVLGAGAAQSAGLAAILNNPYAVVLFAFAGSLIGIVTILALAKFARLSAQAMVLAGIAMGTLFSAATMLLQYFAEDIKVASVVFWTFGDMGRAGKTDVLIMFLITVPALVYFMLSRWEYNVLEGGEETAKALGVNTERLRLVGVLLASLITSVSVAFLGIIGFIGLVAPHMVRRIVGGDHRYLIPISAIFGSLLLLGADTISRTIMPPAVLPVGILTSFMGVPLFMYLIWKKRKQY